MPTLQTEDLELYYEVTGQGDPMLLIHGLGSSTRDWELQVPVFAQRYRVMTFDARGHGQSGRPPGPYSVPQFARDTQALMRALDVAPAHVVGISMGGMIAFQLALDAPELVRSLVIVNAGPELVIRTLGQRLNLWQRHLVALLLGMRKMGEILGQRMFPKPEQEALRHMFVERWAENDPRAWRTAMQAMVGWSVAHRLDEIRCPVLVVTADQDYTPVSAKEAYVARIPQAELVVIEDSRHATPVEKPERFNEVALAFLAGQARQR
jgi:pimeloyl-ACP methyl ester carboxylesterase